MTTTYPGGHQGSGCCCFGSCDHCGSVLRRNRWWSESELFKVVLGLDRVKDGGERLLTQRTLHLVVAPLLYALEAEAMEAPVQIRHVVEAVQTDWAFGVRRRLGRNRLRGSLRGLFLFLTTSSSALPPPHTQFHLGRGHLLTTGIPVEISGSRYHRNPLVSLVS